MTADAERPAAAGCLACGRGDVRPLVDLGTVPLMTGSLWQGAGEARDAPVGHLELVVCQCCGHVGNVAFDETLVAYDADYDNSLHHSPTFRRFAADLAGRLIDRHGLRGRHIVEIGSGKGDFLNEICHLGDNTGTGYDPTVEQTSDDPRVQLVPDYFRSDEHSEPYDLLVCRHVLEHLADPATMLTALRSGAPDGARLYFEVPSARFNFGPSGLWDCIYPHVSYFSTQSLHALVTRCGFEVTAQGSAFDEQFLWAEARPAAVTCGDVPPGVPEHLAWVGEFPGHWQRAVGYWRDELSRHRDDGRTVALWGAGAKGVTFLNATDPDAHLVVTDMNPRKWGRHLPVTGHAVVEPRSLVESAPSTVLMTNPVYCDEITDQLTRLGVAADVLLV